MLYGPQMYSRGRRQPFIGTPSMRAYPMQQSPFSQRQWSNQYGGFPQMMGRGQQRSQGGGLLSKLLGRGAQRNSSGLSGILGTGGSSRAASSGSGLLQSLTNPNALNGILSNTQQVLKTAQQFAPMVQQYGPLVRNLPSMWKLYRGLKDLPDVDEANNEQASEKTNDDKKQNPQPSKKKASRSASKKPDEKKNVIKGASIPKLYI